MQLLIVLAFLLTITTSGATSSKTTTSKIGATTATITDAVVSAGDDTAISCKLSLDDDDENHKQVEEVNDDTDTDNDNNVETLRMKFVVQNLQKRSHMATDLINEHHPDVLLVQEISLYSEDKDLFPTIEQNEEEDYDHKDDDEEEEDNDEEDKEDLGDDDDDDDDDADSSTNKSDSSQRHQQQQQQKQTQHVAYNVYKWFGYGTAIWCRKDKDNSNTNSNSNANTFSLTNIRQVESPCGEIFAGNLVHKLTTIATLNVVATIPRGGIGTAGIGGTEGNTTTTNDGGEDEDENENEEDKEMIMIELVSFHGYNGQPFKNLQKLLAHVQVVLDVLNPESPTIFAGDFNTWSQQHIDAVVELLSSKGFRHVVFDEEPWTYPGRQLPLDHLFIKDGTTEATGTATSTTVDTTAGSTITLDVQNFRTYANKSDHRGAVFDLIVQKKKKKKKKKKKTQQTATTAISMS